MLGTTAKTLTCLSLATAGVVAGASTGDAASAATLSGMVLTAASGLLGNVAGDYATDLFTKGGDKLGGLFAKQFPDIDQNHHILNAMRRAHLAALHQVLADSGLHEAQGEPARFAESLKAYLASEKKKLEGGKGEAGFSEKALFDGLPELFAKGLATRATGGPDRAAEELKTTRRDIETLILAEVKAGAGMRQEERLPDAFFNHFSDETDGWFPLFLRDAADRLKKDEAFKSIWTTEQLSSLQAWVLDIKSQLDRLEGKIDDGFKKAEDEAERRHREMMEAIARDKGVEVDKLYPILDRLGHNNVPQADIPRVLSEAVEHLLAQSERQGEISNDAPAIDQAIQRARDKLKGLDIAGALDELDAAIAEEEAEEARRKKARARLFFEKADILTTTFDHSGAIAMRKKGLELDPENVVGCIKLGDSHRTLGETLQALNAFQEAESQAKRQKDDRHRAAALDRQTNLLMASGSLERAEKAAEQTLDISQKRADEAPEDADRQRDLSVSHNKIGDIRAAQGDLSGALVSYEADLAIAERLAKQDPSHADRQRDLSVSHNKIGDIRATQGDLPGALVSYEDCLAIAERLAEQDPSHVDRQRDLSVSHNKIGDIRAAQGDLTGALVSYEAALTMRKRLAEQDPSHADRQRDLSVSHERIGDIRKAQGDLSGALVSYEADLAIAERLAEQDPSHADRQRDMSVAHEKLGDIRAAQGDLTGALGSYEAALAIRKRLAEQDPSHADRQRDLIVSHVKLSEVDPANARDHLTKALRIARELKQSGRLAPRDDWMVQALEDRLTALDSASDT